jgi:Inner membrane component domain
MRLILNVIWLVLCGWWMAILYFPAGRPARLVNSAAAAPNMVGSPAYHRAAESAASASGERGTGSASVLAGSGTDTTLSGPARGTPPYR